MKRTCLVLFYGRQRPWRSFSSSEDKGVVCELRSLPGGLVTWAETREKAVELMQQRLENAFQRAGGLAEWHAGACAAMTPEDYAQFVRALLEHGPELVAGDGYEYFVVVDSALYGEGEGS